MTSRKLHDTPTHNATRSPPKTIASVYIDSVFPIRFGNWDLRYIIAAFRQPRITDELEGILKDVAVHDFKLLRLEPPGAKDGGVFVEFEYTPASDPKDTVSVLAEIQEALRKAANDHGGIPSWLGLRQGNIWLVKGRPWKEDLNYFPASQLRIEFEGPDVHPEMLYQALRPYGRLLYITRPMPFLSGSPRFSNALFRRVRSAVRAQNCLHGLIIPSNGTPGTRLSLAFDRAIKAHVIRDWLSNHPRIVLPVVAFILGTLTYTIFDPLRTFMVEAKVREIFDYRDYKITHWLKENVVGIMHIDSASHLPTAPRDVWEGRREAETAISSYLSEYPTTVCFLHGPTGSGKSRLISQVLLDHKRPHLIIDCEAILAQASDAGVIAQTAKQTGYWPVFSFLSSISNLIDLISLGLIGQKAGYSSSLDNQLADLLGVIATALRHVNLKHIRENERGLEYVRICEEQEEQRELRRQSIRQGMWHDGRLDCIAGNGIISELGFGDESIRDEDEVVTVTPTANVEISEKGTIMMPVQGSNREDAETRGKGSHHGSGIELSAIPIIIIKNFGAKGGPGTRDIVLDAFSKWTARLVETHIAHVVVVSDNRENVKRLAKSLGLRPLATIALDDADTMMALRFVTARLGNLELMQHLTADQVSHIERLGGRSSNLDALVYKIRSGMSVEAAVEEIIERTMSELRMSAFGGGMDDAKNLPWAQEQAWAIVSKLALKDEIPYMNTLTDFPFNGDDVPLREMEHAELISIVTHEGLPISIRVGRPVYRQVFQRLVEDPIFHSLQEIGFNKKQIASAEACVRACEEELLTLKSIGLDVRESYWSKPPVSLRAKYLMQKMRSCSQKTIDLEKRNAQLKKILAGGPSAPPS